MSKTVVVLFCNCAYSQIVPQNVRRRVLNALSESGLEFKVVQDLCELAAKKDLKLKRWAEADVIKIVACYSRAVKWLFNAAEAPLKGSNVEFLNMRTSTAKKIILSLSGRKTSVGQKREIRLEEKGDWIPWFPVIDYDRCKNCKQCLNFCLFGVYELSKSEQVQVTNPAGCKTNCPACAKLCPHKAIIFPKYSDSPINGDDVDDSQGDSEKTKLDSGAISGDDIYEMLKKRSRTGQRFEKDRADRQEIDLTKLRDQLGIPSEVIESLRPSEVTELRKKSEKKNRE